MEMVTNAEARARANVKDQRDDAISCAEDIGNPVLGQYSLPESQSRPDCTSGAWQVVVKVRERVVSRCVRYRDELWFANKHSGYPENQPTDEVIWPTWPATLKEDIDASASPLADLQRHWEGATNRLRDSAKWLATVLGAALAAVIPTAPLADFNQRHITGESLALGLCGLLSLSITMLLVLQVMRPGSVSYDEIQNASPPTSRWAKRIRRSEWLNDTVKNPLYQWRKNIDEHPDLYLPCGVESLSSLRQLIIVEEITLIALARARENPISQNANEMISDAQAARATRLYELRAAAVGIVSVGVYYKVRASSTMATYGGVLFGFLGLSLIILAVAWPIT
jgi:hypothetical protein